MWTMKWFYHFSSRHVWFGATYHPFITLFLILLFHGSGLSWFRSFSEQGKKHVSTKRHNSSFIELEFEIAAWSSLDFFGGKKWA